MNYNTNTRYTTEPEQTSLGDLFSTLSNQVGLLLRQEMQLAQAEMTRKATRAGRHGAVIGLGAVLGHAALLAIIAGIILALSQVMEAWAAALIVGIALAIIAALMVQYGLKQLKEIDPAPRRTIETMRENKEWLTEQI